MSRDRELLEAVESATRLIARIVGAYRKQLDAEGVNPNEAWALTQRLEERLLGPVFADAEAQLRRSAEITATLTRFRSLGLTEDGAWAEIAAAEAGAADAEGAKRLLDARMRELVCGGTEQA